jgi:hypothetical protein
MSRIAASRLTGGLLCVAIPLLLTACGPSPTARPIAVAPPTPASTEPGQIELSDAKATLAPQNRVRIEVRYRFTQGKPDKYYLCEITFPGTTNVGARPMDSWELKPEGVFKDTVQLNKPPVETFEIRFSEAESPQNGYKMISNVATGKVE